MLHASTHPPSTCLPPPPPPPPPPSPQPGGDLQESGIATLDLSPFTVMKTPAKGFDDSTHASLDSSRFSTASRDTLRDLSLREKGAARKEAEV